MPVIAIGAAIGASVLAGSAVAATVGGIAAISAVTALEVVAAVGATISAVGVVTRDKGLTMAGTVIGAIGAVGGLAAGAGLLGDAASSSAPLFGAAPAASTADATAAATDAAGTAAGGAVDSSGNAAASAASADQASSGTVDFVNGTVPPPPPSGTAMSAADQSSLTQQVALGQSGNTTANGLVTSEPAATGAGAAATPAVAAPSNPALPGMTGPGTSDLIPPPPAPPANLGATDPVTGQTITTAVDPVSGKVVSLPDSPGAFGGLLDFANKNAVVTLGALQAGGSMLAGLTSPVTPAQVSALNAQAAANDAAAAMQKQQQQNLAMPKSVASSAPVTGAPMALTPPNPTPGAPAPAVVGLINRPAVATQVTGAPA